MAFSSTSGRFASEYLRQEASLPPARSVALGPLPAGAGVATAAERSRPASSRTAVGPHVQSETGGGRSAARPYRLVRVENA
jgi:hypothetical protein